MRSRTYSEYLQLDELLSLQQPKSDGPEHDEMLFIVIHQVYELWFKQLLHELDACVEAFDADHLLQAHKIFRRVTAIQRVLKSRYCTPLGIAGVVVFTATGLLATAGGGRFLQHDKLPFGLEQATLRSTGILLVELGVALAVTGTLVALFDDLAGEPEEDDAPEPEAEAR